MPDLQVIDFTLAHVTIPISLPFWQEYGLFFNRFCSMAS
jgi:hypothetical protein